ncbi:MAG: Hsp20/alpha crystallin family protein [Flavobacteriales bacterium]|nr:Hsp20/alpha crystallin family protein [Flavobacteriales bacterium]
MTLVKFKRPNSIFPSMFDELWKEFPGTAQGVDQIPAANIKENETNYYVEVSAPGFSKENINVSVEDDVLIITGEMNSNTEEKKENYLKREFRTGSFKRSFNLNGMVDVDKIDAKYEDGILKADLPKVETEIKKLKEIKVG